MAQSAVINFKPGQLDLFQVSDGALWHKWAINGQWRNEPIALPAGFAAAGKPEVSVLGGACWVSVESSANPPQVAVFMQTAASGTWQNSELP